MIAQAGTVKEVVSQTVGNVVEAKKEIDKVNTPSPAIDPVKK